MALKVGNDPALSQLVQSITPTGEPFDSVAACLGISPNEPLPIVPPNADDVPAVVLDPSRTREAFGWTAKVPVEEGIPKFVEWFKGYNRL